ncbi:MAG: hypothetical protein V4550_13125 [Gemmatimonadota bacterium]
MSATPLRCIVGFLCAIPVVASAQSEVTLLGYRTTAPSSWVTRAPASSMRLAEFVAPGAEVIVYFFGKGQGGTVAANTERWKSQFSNPDGAAVYEKVTRDSSGAFPVTYAEYRGTYARGVGAGDVANAKPGQTLVAAIAETPNGMLFIHLFGASGTVAAQRDALVTFVKGLH